MAYGDRELARDSRGADVVELQMRLAGFRGTVPDGPHLQLSWLHLADDLPRFAQGAGRPGAKD